MKRETLTIVHSHITIDPADGIQPGIRQEWSMLVKFRP